MRARARRLVRETDVPPGRPRLQIPREDIRPSVAVRLHGDRQPLEGRTLGSVRADGSLHQSRAKYFVALANHHDNFDPYDSTHHRLELRPDRAEEGHRRNMGEARARRAACASASRITRRMPGTGFRPPTATTPKDRTPARDTTPSASRRKMGRGKWWEGLDPQELYTGPNLVMPDGITTIKDANAWHDRSRSQVDGRPPANNPDFVDRWFLRCQELIDKYQPDRLFLDDTELPLGQAGLDIAAHFYNSNIHRRGRLEAVLTSKGLRPDHAWDDGARHRARAGRPDPGGRLADRHVHRRLALPACDLR